LLASTLADQLESLYKELVHLSGEAQRDGLIKPASTIYGRLDQAFKWCINPIFNDKSIGQEATKSVVEIARKLALDENDNELRSAYLECCQETNNLIDKLIESNDNKKTTISNEAIKLGKQLRERLYQISQIINRCLVQKVAHNFVDINHPLRKLADLVDGQIEQGTIMNDELIEKFNNYSNNLIGHTEKLCNTAQLVASSKNQTRNKRAIELINILKHR
jgi:vinculin